MVGIPSDGCSKPKSLIARKSSAFNKKSLIGGVRKCGKAKEKGETNRKPVEWTPTYFCDFSLSSSSFDAVVDVAIALAGAIAEAEVIPFSTSSS